LEGSFLPLTGGTVTGPLNYTATGGTVSRSAQDRAAEVVNVKDFGAKGDGTTDDTASINAAIAHAALVLTSGVTVVVSLPPGIYRCNATVNLTGIRAYNAGMFCIEANGATIQSYATTTPAVDATWTQCLHINGLTIGGTATYGLQLGIKDTTGNGNAADWRVTNLTVSGTFSQAAIWNVGAETGLWTGLRISNGHATGDGIRMDGLNHYNLSSAFQTVSLAVNALVSFNDNLFVAPIVQVQGGKCLWLAANAGTRFDGGYGSTTGANAVALFTQSGSDGNRHVRLSMHFETVSIADVVLITGPYATPNLQCFEYVDFYAQATNSIFKLDTGVTQCAMQGARLAIGDGTGGWTKVFDNPGAWNVSGYASMDVGSTKWNLSNTRFSGLLSVSISATVNAGSVNLNDASAPLVAFPAAGAAPPSFPTRSLGEKITLYPTINSSNADYAIGIDANTMWLGLPQATSGNYVSVYGGSTMAMAFAGNGLINLLGAGAALQISNNQIVGPRINGWGTSTGGVRGAITGASTLPQVAAAVAQLLTDLKTHGMLGT
jgi:hypothetical protein